MLYSKLRITYRGQETPLVTGKEAIALGISWVGWRSPEAPRWQQRRGYSDRTSERSRDLVGARVVWEAKKTEKLGLRRP